MCYRPIHITNKSLHFSPETMPTEFVVPCGHCEACLNQRRQEWFARSYYHWQAVKKAGGCGFFYTLTFDKEHLTMIDGKPCFNKQVVQLFVKRLKEHLMRKWNCHLDVLITSEYGDLFARPHHHAAFYLSRHIPAFAFYKIVEQTWHQGFVYSGRDGGYINSPSAILYVTKYVTKDSLFPIKRVFMHFALKHYRLFLRSIEDSPFYSQSDIDNLPIDLRCFVRNKSKYLVFKEIRNWYNSFQREFKSFIPFVVHSNYLGYDIINSPSFVFEDKEMLLLPNKKGYDTIPLPRYIKRSLWYDRVANEYDGKLTRFVLNARGKSHKAFTLQSKVDDFKQQVDVFIRDFSISNNEFQSLNLLEFDSASDLSTYIRHCDIDTYNLAIYKCCFRGRSALSSPSVDLFKDWHVLSIQWLYTSEDVKLPPLSQFDSSKRNFLLSNLYGSKPQFQPYEYFLTIYEKILHFRNESYYNEKVEKTLNARRLRDVIKLTKLKINNYEKRNHQDNY